MSGPAPATVPQNRWRDIDVAPVSESPAAATVSVLLDGAPAEERASSAALAAQTYPAELVEVIGPGGEAKPSGDIVILLAAGAVPEPEFVAAHARWHHESADVVSFGPLAGEDADDDPLSWVVDLTRDFTDLGEGHHLAAAEGTVGMRRALYDEAGGAGKAAPDLWRLDLALRLHCAGAVFVAEPAALARGRASGIARAVAAASAAGRSLELEHPGAAALIPLPPWRAPASARYHERPAMTVNLDAAGAPAEESLATIAGVLGGRFGDLELRVQVPAGDPARDAIAAAVAADPRAALASTSLDEPCETPVQVTLPAAAALDPRTLADLHELALDEDAGAFHVTVPGAAPQDTMITVVMTAAWRRSRRLAATSGDPAEAIMGELFSERWMSGVEVSTRRHGVEEPQVTEHGPLAAATDLDHERKAHVRFRERSNDMAERARTLARRTMAERLRAREQRRAAERVEERLGERA